MPFPNCLCDDIGGLQTVALNNHAQQLNLSSKTIIHQGQGAILQHKNGMVHF